MDPWEAFYHDLHDYATAWGLSETANALYSGLALTSAWYGYPVPPIISGRRSKSWTAAAQNRWDSGDREGLNVRPASNSQHHGGDGFDLCPDHIVLDSLGKLAYSWGYNWGGNWTHPDRNHFDVRTH